MGEDEVLLNSYALFNKGWTGMTKTISDEQAKQLLNLARETIAAKLAGKDQAPLESSDPGLQTECGTFVTLKIDGQLRGCIGNLSPSGSLYQGIQRNSLSAAFDDHRFPPLSREELDKIHVDISILTVPEELSYKDGDDLIRQLRPGIDGVILKLGINSATFLPQVWDQLPKPELFLGHLCRKAGLTDTAWRDLHPDIEIYQVQCFEEE